MTVWSIYLAVGLESRNPQGEPRIQRDNTEDKGSHCIVGHHISYFLCDHIDSRHILLYKCTPALIARHSTPPLIVHVHRCSHTVSTEFCIIH